MSNTIIKALTAVKAASSCLLSLTMEKRDALLQDLALCIHQATSEIIAANQKDLALMDSEDPKYDRLLLSEDRIKAIANAVQGIADLNYPLATLLEERLRPNGLKIQKIACPLGVVAVIYESRPNVTIDVFTLCFKSGNACVLKGGKEAYHSNQCLLSLIHKTLQKHALPSDIVYLLPTEPKALDTLLRAHGLVDVCIPRGGQSLIQYVREKAQIPLIETGAGIVHTYFDVSGEVAIAKPIINNAKTRRVSVCNALDTLIIHEQRLSDLPELLALLIPQKVGLFADAASYQALQGHYPKDYLHQAREEDFGREFLSYQMAIKTVDSVSAAIAHIQAFSSGHSEAIIAEDKAAISLFVKSIDAAAVYVNASTAFTDGEEFGMGAEIGISTQKLHARGPMALEALSTYKWVIWGEGQIR